MLILATLDPILFMSTAAKAAGFQISVTHDWSHALPRVVQVFSSANIEIPHIGREVQAILRLSSSCAVMSCPAWLLAHFIFPQALHPCSGISTSVRTVKHGFIRALSSLHLCKPC